MEIVFLFAMVIGFLLIGVPIAISLGLSSIIFLLVLSDSSLGSVAQTLFNAFAGHFTPPVDMKVEARMKKGIASSVK